MVPKSESDTIIDHVLANDADTELALKIGSAYTDLRSRIISDFMGRVAGVLMPKLAGRWMSHPVDPLSFMEERWDLFKLQLLNNPAEIRINIGHGDGGVFKNPYVAVRTEVVAFNTSEVNSAIGAAFAKGPKSDVSVWYQYFHKLLGTKHLDWGSNEMSLEMVRSVEIVELVANRLEKLCAAVEAALMEIGQRAVSSTPSEEE